MTLYELQTLFPKTRQNEAVTGYIPMAWVNQHMDELAELIKNEGLRRFYRGPRPDRYATDTRRDSAEFMVLYFR